MPGAGYEPTLAAIASALGLKGKTKGHGGSWLVAAVTQARTTVVSKADNALELKSIVCQLSVAYRSSAQLSSPQLSSA